MKKKNFPSIVEAKLDLVDEIFPRGDNDTLKSLKFFNDARKQLFLKELTEQINKNTTAAATLRGKSTSNLYSEIRKILSSKKEENENDIKNNLIQAKEESKNDLKLISQALIKKQIIIKKKNDLKLIVQILLKKKITEGSIVNLQNAIKSIHNIVSSSKTNATLSKLEKTITKEIILKTLKKIVKIENEQTKKAEGCLLDYIKELKESEELSEEKKESEKLKESIKHLALRIIPYYKYLNKIKNESEKIYTKKTDNKQVNLDGAKQIAIHNIFYFFSNFSNNNEININLNKALYTNHNIKLLSKDLLCTEAFSTRETRLKKVKVNIKNYQGLPILSLNKKLKEFINHLSENRIQLSEDDKKNTTNIIKYLIDIGANIESIDKNGYSALYRAIFDNNIDVIKLLIEAGADIESVNKDGTSALNCAMLKKTDAVKLLIEAGADIESVNKDEGSALHFAILYGNTNAIKLLIEAGANIKFVNIFRYSALDCAKSSGNQKIIEAVETAIKNKEKLDTKQKEQKELKKILDEVYDELKDKIYDIEFNKETLSKSINKKDIHDDSNNALAKLEINQEYNMQEISYEKQDQATQITGELYNID